MRDRAIGLLLLFLVAACSKDGLKENGFRCSTSGTCPDGYRCLDDRCWRGGVLPDGQAPAENADASSPVGGKDGAAGTPMTDGQPASSGPDTRPGADLVAVPADATTPLDASIPLPDVPLASPDTGGPAADLGSGRANGSPCTRREDCLSGICAPDGTCCESDCTSVCEACNVAGSLGRCTRVPSGQPRGKPACGGAGECAGSCNGTTASCVFPTSACGSAMCSGNLLLKGGACSGGTCAPGGTQDCGAFRCVGGACKSSCSTDGDCAPSHYCVGASGCVPTKANGLGCTAPSQCSSGYCRDQVCCNEDCTGTCKTCATGSCTNVIDNVDSDTCNTTKFCGSGPYLGMCILGMVLNRNLGLVPEAFYAYPATEIGQEAIQTLYLSRPPGLPPVRPTINLTGLNTDQFMIVSDVCTNSTIVPGMHCELQVRFAPTVAGNFQAIIEALDEQGNKARFAVSGKTP